MVVPLVQIPLLWSSLPIIMVGPTFAPEVVFGMNVCDKRLLKIVKIRLPSDGRISRTKTGKQVR